jgi:hypothetical protein
MVAGVVIPPHLIPIKTSAVQTPNVQGTNTPTILRQLKESIEVAQRLRGDVGDSYVRVSELVGLGLATIVNGTIQLANGAQPGQLPTIPGTGGGGTTGGGGGGSGGTGATGSQGPQGPPGADGSDGDDGMSIIGPAGPAGAQGADGISGIPVVLYPEDPDDPEFVPGIPGPTGPAGPAGPSGVGSAVPDGMNLVFPVANVSSTGSWSNYTTTTKMDARGMLRYSNGWQFNFVIDSGSADIGQAVIQQCLAGTTTIVNTVTVTWSGNPTPTLNAGENWCDQLTLFVDSDYDYYAMVFLPSSSNNSGVVLGTGSPEPSGYLGVSGGYQSGNSIGTVPSLSTAIYAILAFQTIGDTTGGLGPVGPMGPVGPPGTPEDPDDPPVIPGAPGAPGATGATGSTGAQGVVGPAGPAIYFEADTGEDTIQIPGPVGPPGLPGIAGSAFQQEFDDEDWSYLNRPHEPKVLSGSVTVTATGITGTTTGTLLWWVFGPWLLMLVPGITGTSTSTAFTLTYTAGQIPVPVRFSQWWPVATFEDNSSSTGNFAAEISSNGVFTFLKNLSSAGFTNGGTKGISSQFLMIQSLI